MCNDSLSYHYKSCRALKIDYLNQHTYLSVKLDDVWCETRYYFQKPLITVKFMLFILERGFHRDWTIHHILNSEIPLYFFAYLQFTSAQKYSQNFSQFIYPGQGKPLDVRQVDGQYEAFTLVEKTTKQNLANLLANENSTVVTESLLAGAIAMALCYIARLQRTKAPGVKVSYFIAFKGKIHMLIPA